MSYLSQIHKKEAGVDSAADEPGPREIQYAWLDPFKFGSVTTAGQGGPNATWQFQSIRVYGVRPGPAEGGGGGSGGGGGPGGGGGEGESLGGGAGAGSAGGLLGKPGGGLGGLPTSASSSGGGGSSGASSPPPLARLDDVTGRIIDPLGYEYFYKTDRYGWLTRLVDPLGRTTEWVRNQHGLVTQLVEPDPDGGANKRITSFSYDGQGNLTGATLPGGATLAWTYDATYSQLTSFTDPLGRTTTWVLDAQGNAVQEIRPDGAVTDMAYSTHGQLTQITLPDPDGPAGPLTRPTTTYTYDARGRVTMIVHPDGAFRTMEYDAADNLTRLVDERGTAYTSTYDALDRRLTHTLDADGLAYLYALEYVFAEQQPVKVTDPLGRETTYAYDIQRSLKQVTTPLSTVTMQHDAMGQLLLYTDEIGIQSTFRYDAGYRMTHAILVDSDGLGPGGTPDLVYQYDALDRMTKQTDALGRETRFDYDLMDRLVTVTDALGGTTQMAYDLAGRMTSHADALGRQTAYAYHPLVDWLESATLPDPGAGAPVWTFAHDALGRVTTRTDPLGRATSFGYDPVGRVTQVTEPDPDGAGPDPAPVWTTVYDGGGLVTSAIDPLGAVTGYEYDALRRLVTLTQADPDTGGPLAAPRWTFTYDAVGNLLAETNPLGHATAHEYDALARRVKTTEPHPNTGQATGPVWTYEYDAEGKLTRVVDPLLQATAYQYDAYERLTRETDPRGGATSFSYDAVGNLTGLSDAVGNTTTWAYDAVSRPTSETNVLGHARAFVYDAVGNLRSRTDRNGRVVERDFDALDRLIQERWLDAAQTLVETIDYGYDLADQLTSAADSRSAYAYTYDGLGRVTREDNAGGILPHVVLDQAWDLVGRRTRLAAQVAGAADLENRYQYDLLGRMTRAEQTGQPGGAAVAAKRVDFQYDPLGRFSRISRFAGLGGTSLVADTLLSFDAGGNLDSLTHRQGQTNTLADYIWTHDDLHRVTSFWSQADGTANYSYDPANQVTGATYDYQANENFSFDLNGNRSMPGYTTGANNRLVSDGVFDYTYDNEGNRTLRTEIATGRSTEYQWDHRNRLVAIIERDGAAQVTRTVEYAYDLFDRRIQKSVAPAVGPAEVEQLVPDGVHTLLRFKNGSLASRYLYGPAVDQILADEQLDPSTGQTDRLLWPLADNLGTIRDVAEFNAATGTTSVVNHIVFDAFGRITSESDPSVDHAFGYTGRDRDPESDLYYYRARYYDPATGRFVSEDPIGFWAGDGNLNRYVGNKATLVNDPFGLQDSAPDPSLNPAPWPNARPRPAHPQYQVFDGGFVLKDIPRDKWGLPTGFGRWRPGEFFRFSEIAEHQTRYGCGGLMAMRVGLAPNEPLTIVRVKSAKAFGSVKDALEYLQGHLRGDGLIVLAEASKPFPLLSGKALVKDGFRGDACDIRIDSAYNYRTLLGNHKDWYWEHASGPWKRGGTVIHDRSKLAKAVVIIVVPNAASISPIPPELLDPIE